MKPLALCIMLISGLSSAAVKASVIENGSFDGSSLTGWTWEAVGDFRRNVEYLGTDNSAEGYAARIYSSHNNYFTAGNYGSLYQDVNLTGIDTISFDAQLTSCGSCGNWSDFKASFSIGGSSYWNSSSSGSYSSIVIDVSGLTGINRIAFKNEALSTGYFTSKWFKFDNVDTTGIGVAPVPLPASGLLLVAGIGGFAAFRRKKKS